MRQYQSIKELFEYLGCQIKDEQEGQFAVSKNGNEEVITHKLIRATTGEVPMFNLARSIVERL